MRELINIITSLLESTTNLTPDELDALKGVIAGKIKDLPNDEVTAKALQEIEDLLSHLGAGGRMGVISKELSEIDDPKVIAAQKLLSRYILSLDMTADQRKQLFTLWKEDKLVNRKKLLTIGRKSISEIISHYDSNPAIKELVDDLMKVSALGQGKGEFALTVLSKSISKPEKGDLIIDGTLVEVKTTDGGSGRFTDQEVRPGAGFEEAAKKVEDLLRPYSSKVTTSGFNLADIVQLYQKIKNIDSQQAKDVLAAIEKCIGLIFDGEDVKPIITAIDQGNTNAAKQEYVKTSFNYYISKKEDEGVLYINLTTNPVTLIWFKDADDLAVGGMRLHAHTIYPTNTADYRLPYPQTEIIDTQARVSQDKVSTAASDKKSAAISQKIADIDRPVQGIRPKRVEIPMAARDETTREKR